MNNPAQDGEDDQPAPLPDHDNAPLQWMQRRLSPDGSQELIEGETTVRFAARQKQAALHLAFSPPLAGIPAVECEPLDAAEVRWKLAVAQPYGVRIDVQRSGNFQTEFAVRLAWFATSRILHTDAA